MDEQEQAIWATQGVAALKAAQAEIARLRAALEEIIELNPATGHLEMPQTRIARKALAGEQP
jgi:hypothetical protein